MLSSSVGLLFSPCGLYFYIWMAQPSQVIHLPLGCLEVTRLQCGNTIKSHLQFNSLVSTSPAAVPLTKMLHYVLFPGTKPNKISCRIILYPINSALILPLILRVKSSLSTWYVCNSSTLCIFFAFVSSDDVIVTLAIGYDLSYNGFLFYSFVSVKTFNYINNYFQCLSHHIFNYFINLYCCQLVQLDPLLNLLGRPYLSYEFYTLKTLIALSLFPKCKCTAIAPYTN